MKDFENFFQLGLTLFLTLWAFARFNRQPVVTLAWIFSFWLFPYYSFAAYGLFSFRILARRRRLKRMILPDLSKSKSKTHERVIPNSAEISVLTGEITRQLACLIKNLSGFKPVTGNQLSLSLKANVSLAKIEQAICSSQHEIFIQYYIFKPDQAGRQIRDLLISKAKQGVKIYMLLDHVGSFELRYSFYRPLIQSGVQFRFFNPLRLRRPWSAQLRNHRKALIVDRKVACVGSQNIGNEYFRGALEHFKIGASKSWTDTLIRVEGPVVVDLVSVFKEDWLISGASEQPLELLPIQLEGTTSQAPSRHGTIQVFPTGPDEAENSMEMVLISALHLAKKEVQIVSPYLVPSSSLLLAMQSAVLKGVSVQIIVPEKSDHLWIDWVARSWFSEFCRIGVQVYSYKATFLHAKAVSIDQECLLMGSANMDERSFKLNYELTLLIEDAGVLSDFHLFFDETKASSVSISTQGVSDTLLKRMWDGFFRVFSPLF